MFLTNSCPEDYCQIKWLSKRSGLQAYSIYGEEVVGLMPVFVKKEAYDEGMKNKGGM